MKKYLFLFILIFIHLFLLANLQFTAWPEMVLYPYLFNKGFKLYSDFIHPYPPLLTVILAFFYKIFGYKLIILKFFTWGLVVFNDILIFLIVKKLTKKFSSSIISLSSYVLLQTFLEGNMLWFDTAIVTPILLSIYFLLQEKSNKNLFLSGLFIGIACLIKQTVGIFLIFNGLWIIVKKTTPRNIFVYLSGPAILGILLITYLIRNNSLGDFLNWTLIYPAKYWTKFPGYVQMSLSGDQIFILFLLIFPLIFFLFKGKSTLFSDRNFLLFTFYFLLSVAIVYPRFSFFHLQTALAFLAILYGFIYYELKPNLLLPILFFFLFTVFIAMPILKREWSKETRFWTKTDLLTARIISEKTKGKESIFLLGLNSGLYVLSDRLPPKPWTDNFGWYLEIPRVQEEILASWQEDPPGLVFWQDPAGLPAGRQGNWFDLGVYQPLRIGQWIVKNYNRREQVWEGVWVWQKSLPADGRD